MDHSNDTLGLVRCQQWLYSFQRLQQISTYLSGPSVSRRSGAPLSSFSPRKSLPPVCPETSQTALVSSVGQTSGCNDHWDGNKEPSCQRAKRGIELLTRPRANSIASQISIKSPCRDEMKEAKSLVWISFSWRQEEECISAPMLSALPRPSSYTKEQWHQMMVGKTTQ